MFKSAHDSELFSRNEEGLDALFFRLFICKFNGTIC